MYKFYRQAKECYAFLDDVFNTRETLRGTIMYGLHSDDFCHSRWFSRGWTLQELLAHSDVLFYDRRGDYLASRADHCEMISQATGIPQVYLVGKRQIRNASVARRMSWAANRKTTRVEDRAYSLLGLFDVNMPLLYGEENKAFLRLQLEIIQRSYDQSIFAWGFTSKVVSLYGVLADTPASFKRCGDIISAPSLVTQGLKPVQVTNRGIRYPYRRGICDVLHSLFKRATGLQAPKIRIQLPFAMESTDPGKGHLMLSLSPVNRSYDRERSTYERIGVHIDSRSSLLRFLNTLMAYDSEAYVPYTRHADPDWIGTPEIFGHTSVLDRCLEHLTLRPTHLVLCTLAVFDLTVVRSGYVTNSHRNTVLTIISMFLFQEATSRQSSGIIFHAVLFLLTIDVLYLSKDST